PLAVRRAKRFERTTVDGRLSAAGLIPAHAGGIVLIRLERGHNRLFAAQPLALRLRQRLLHAAVVLRHDLDELGRELVPQREHLPGARALGIGRVALEHLFQFAEIALVEPLERHRLLVAAVLERSVLVEHIGDAARHAGGEVAPGLADDGDAPAGHVFAAVVADAFDHSVDAAVAHTEALARDAADIRFAAGRTVERDVADDDVLLGREGRARRRIEHDLAAAEPLAEVV